MLGYDTLTCAGAKMGALPISRDCDCVLTVSPAVRLIVLNLMFNVPFDSSLRIEMSPHRDLFQYLW